jgi:chitinase
VNGPLTINLYASGVSGAINGVPISVTVFADADFSDTADPEQPQRIVATGTITGTAGPPGVPALITGEIPVVDGAPAVVSRLHIQVASGDITEPVTLQVYYASASARSGFEEPVAPPPDPGESQASAGPRIPPPSAGSSGLNVAAVPTRGTPTAADVAAGTARCAPVRYKVPPGTGKPSLRIADVNEWEGSAVTGNHQVSVPVTLSGPTNQTVRVHFATRNGTASAPSDYLARSGTLTFVPGQTSSAVQVTFVGENRPEPDERFFVDLSAPVNATVADGTATVTIRKFE